MSHSRFWAVHVLFTAFPVLFFYGYAINKTSLLRKYQHNKKKLDLLESDKGKFRKTVEVTMHALDYKRTKKRDKRLRRIVNSYRNNVGSLGNDFDRYRFDQREMEETERRIVKEYVHFGYLLHCIAKIIFELIALYFAYWLQFQQSQKLPFFECFTVPEKYVCKHAEDFYDNPAFSPCSQQEEVSCWVSRPKEKQLFLRYMLFTTFLSIFLAAVDFLVSLTRYCKNTIRKKKDLSLAMQEKKNRGDIDDPDELFKLHGEEEMSSEILGVKNRKIN